MGLEDGGSYLQQIIGRPREAPRVNLISSDVMGIYPMSSLPGKAGFYREVIHSVFPPIPFPDHSFDSVLLIDVIEHLKEEEGRELLAEAKRVTSQRLIISTPNWNALRPAHLP